MSKVISAYRNVIITALLVEFVVFVTLSNFLKLNGLFALSLYVLIKNSILIMVIYFLCRKFDEEQVDISATLGEDTANACYFGGVALVKYDENRNVTWVSELLKELEVDIVGQKILEWQPSIEVLFEEESVKTINIRSKKFEVFNNTSSRVLYLSDVTEYYYLNKNYSEEQAVLGYLSIDNYDDTIASVDEQKVALIQSTIRNFIVKWANDYNIVLKRYKSDGYILLFNEQIYKALVQDKFNLLEQVKKEADELGIVITLSVGIARKYGALKELEEIATSAINLAYSRGGDQVVIKSADEQVRFFGGTSETSSKNNKVRARVIARTLRNLIKTSDNVIIMGHKFSDLDSFGASIGMYKIVESYDTPAHIVVDMASMEDKTYRAAVELKKNPDYHGVVISPTRALEIVKPTTLLIVVDNHKASLAIDRKIIDFSENIVIVDHHRRGEEFIDGAILTYLEPTSSSTVELITELFDYQEAIIKLSEEEATIMYAGMLVDTNNFKSRVGVRTFQSATKLKEQGVSISKAYEYLEDDFESFKSIVGIMQTAYKYKEDILIAYSPDNGKIEQAMLAKVGNQLLATSKTNAVFTVGHIGDNHIAISARSTKKINVQIIMEKLGGGGHFSMAACQFKNTTIDEVIKILEEKITEYINEREE